MRKKALIIAYYWPPAGGPGVQRWLKFVKYLREFDVEPIVYVPENPNYPLVDDSLVDDIPKDIRIIKQPIKEPYKLANKISRKGSQMISKGIIKKPKNQSVKEKLLLFIRGNFFIPDARKKWVKPSVNYLSTYIRDYNIETIITTGPPHSLHLIGMKLKQKFDLKWIADFRDPWTTIGYHKKLRLLPMAKTKHQKLEQLVLQNADHVVVTSPRTKQEFKAITTKPITVITNGYDVNSVRDVVLDTKFSISHIGSLLSDRNPKTLWKVIRDVARDDKIFQSHLQINFVGAVSEEVLKSIDAYNLSQFVNIVGYIPHKEAVRYQKKSQLLLLIEIDSDDTKCIIPGKLFEYMVSNRPILAIGPKDSDVKNMIQQTNTGAYFDYLEYDAIKNKLLEYFDAFRHHNLQSHGIGLQQYSRKSLTKKLAALIHG